MQDELVPLCFGAITLYSTDSDRCLACASFQECGEIVHTNIKEAARVLDVESLLTRHRALTRRRQQDEKPDDGKLKTQAPPVQRNVEVGTAKLTESAGTPVLELKALASSILLPLLNGGTVDELRAELQAGRNPFPQSMTEQWVLCELLRRGAVSRAVIEQAVYRVSSDRRRGQATFTALVAAKIVTPGPDALIAVNPAL